MTSKIVYKGRINIPAKSLLFILSFVALLIYSMQRLHICIPALINNYVNDFLCLPLLLSYLTLFFRWLKKDNSFSFSLFFVIWLASYYALYFEYYLPKYDPRYTGDFIDVALYFSSVLIFYHRKYLSTFMF